MSDDQARWDALERLVINTQFAILEECPWRIEDDDPESSVVRLVSAKGREVYISRDALGGDEL